MMAMRCLRARRKYLLHFIVSIFCALSSLTAWSEGRKFDTRKSERQKQRPSTRLFRFDLHPSSAQVELKRREKRRRRLSTNNYSANAIEYPSDWFLAEQNAVYATIPDSRDPNHRHNRHLLQFHQWRHLSRYEIAYRRQANITLDLDWNGTYEYSSSFSSWRNLTESTTAESEATLIAAASDTAVTASTTPHGNGFAFDNYQAVPLSQGYGTHFANIWVGSPTPQRKTVIVDTGSHYTAFPCSGCVNCGRPHHTDPYFNPRKSKSFRLLQCDECRDGVMCDNGQCRFSQSYTEGSSWEAVQVEDRFYCGGTDVLDSVDPNDSNYAIEFMFGCQTAMTGLFITQLADGIMGLSQHQATLVKNLYDKRLIENNLFAMCYRRELGTSKRGVTAGSMTIGGFSSSLDTSPMIYAKNMASVGWFTVYVKNIYVRSGGGQSALSNDPNHKTIRVHIDPAALNSGKGVIVDSGTTDTYLNVKVSREFSRAWKAATGAQYTHSPIKLSKEELLRLPTILVQCHAYSQRDDPSVDDHDSIPGYVGKLDPKNKNDLLIAIPATSYMDYSPVTKLYTSRVYFTETAGGVLGSNAMQGHNVVFDWGNGRVGFAESSCTYDKKDVPPPVLDTGYSSDCLVGDPILTQTCLDTVDQVLCRYHPNNIALLGTEVWTAVVESAGSETGSTCIESIKGITNAEVLDTPVVQCKGDGLCQEERPCQLNCKQLDKALKVRPVNDERNGDSGCGDSFWSACDYGCKQSRVHSRLHTDGICHEVLRETRPCHIGACARSDPCRVPFLIHAVLGLKGADINKWSLGSEDSLSIALRQACERISKGGSLFEEGDVNILAVLPWNRYEEALSATWAVNDDAAKKQPLVDDAFGVKVVLEISIHNPLPKSGNVSLTENVDDEGRGKLSSIMRNFNLRKPRTTCNSDDLYSLAKRALELRKEVLAQKKFIPILIEELKRSEGLMDPDSRSELLLANYESPFTLLYYSDERVIYSKMLSAWSIRTEVDNEINYFGPPKPFWFRILTFIHTLVFALMSFMLLTTAWSILLACIDTFTDDAPSRPNRFLHFWRRPRLRNPILSSIDRDAAAGPQAEDNSLRALVEVELAMQSPRYHRETSGTSPKKRRSTQTLLNSSTPTSSHEKERLL
ncbi:hypothetical protein MPSEU_000355600 [Mayamaea pseudoterrestris]|nr:hypothetical protein MPSEU_000355600 [Mayamaea pseudoterrestris]